MNELIELSLDTENAEKNYSLAKWYESQGHTAPAHSYYLRAAERSDDDNLSYQALLRASFCYRSQGSRDGTEKILLENALTLLPQRPEAYYFLSLFYEKRREWQNSYIYAHLGLQFCSYDSLSVDIPEFLGKYLLIYQKAVAAWWWGRGKESRELFYLLSNDYWDIMSNVHKKSVEDNISRLGKGPDSQAFTYYYKKDCDKLRFKFDGCENIDKNHSQIYQDIFVLSMLNGKKEGTYLEVGGGDPFSGNNTALLETKYDWKGVSIEINDDFVSRHLNARKNKILKADALTVDYKKLLSEQFNTKEIDYLQLDVEPAKNTFEVLLSIPFDEYKFAVITYEHDYYIDITKSYRDKSRRYLSMMGYKLVVSDVSPDGISSFEDWWVHPDLVNPDIISLMEDISPKTKKAQKYIFNN